MRAHAEAIGNRLEIFRLLVNAFALAPPPGLMDEWPVRGIHESDDAMIDAGGHVGDQVCKFVLVAEGGNPRHRDRRIVSFGETCTGWRGLGDEDPDKSVTLFAG